MRYTADAITQALERPTIRLGRSDHALATERPFGWRLRRWWTRRFRTWQPCLISTPQMLALQAAHTHGAVFYVVTLASILRAVFPRRWWYRLTGDPVVMILALGQRAPELQALVLRRLVTAVGETRSRAVEEDPVEIVRRAQRALVYGEEHAKPGISLAVAALTVRAAYGDAWYWNPQRWPTADGYAPFAVCLLEYAGLQALDARRRLEVADGYAIAHAKDPRRVREKLEKMAYPSDMVS